MGNLVDDNVGSNNVGLSNSGESQLRLEQQVETLNNQNEECDQSHNCLDMAEENDAELSLYYVEEQSK